MLNIVIPMAGRGSRFAAEGYTDPKPLVPIVGRPMIDRVIGNLRPSTEHRFIFLCLAEHLDCFPLEAKLRAWAPGCEIVPVAGVTDGAACTVLLAADLIDSHEPLMIANSDQWIDIPIDQYLGALDEDPSLDGLIMTMTADHPKWSYIRLDGSRVLEILEKVVISNEATVGIYNYRHGDAFVRSARAMIVEGALSNGEYYVAPSYNWLIAEGANIGYYNVGTEGAGMHGLGTPGDLSAFIASGRIGDTAPA